MTRPLVTSARRSGPQSRQDAKQDDPRKVARPGAPFYLDVVCFAGVRQLTMPGASMPRWDRGSHREYNNPLCSSESN